MDWLELVRGSDVGAPGWPLYAPCVVLFFFIHKHHNCIESKGLQD